MDLFRGFCMCVLVHVVLGFNDTDTPYEHLGVGYNLLAGNPDVHPDPGFQINGRIFELTGQPPNLTDAVYQKFEPCQQQQQTVSINNIDDYRRQLMSDMHISRHSSKFLAEAFTHSDEFHAMNLTLQTAAVQHVTTSCKHGIASLTTGTVGNELFVGNITQDFAADVCSLPMTMTPNNTEPYFRFLDRWGTSIVIRVDVGTITVQKTNQPSSTKRSSSVTYKRLADADPIAMALVPISYAFDWIIWERSITQWVTQGVCSSKYASQSNIVAISNNIDLAIDQYSNWIPYPLTTVTTTTTTTLPTTTTTRTSTAPPTSTIAPSTTKIVHTTRVHTSAVPHVTVYQPPATWPYGTYGLLEAAHGCPGGGVRWYTGWRKFDTEDTNSDNAFSTRIEYSIHGNFGENDIRIYFCIKRTAQVSVYDTYWPAGSYCIFKVNTCPKGFHDGYIKWDDDDWSNHNEKNGYLPDGTYDDNTLIRFCCRNDGSPRTEIELPTQSPFLLVQYSSTCQQVRGMRSRQVYIYWDNEDLFNKDENGGMHPLEDGGSKDVKLHFCYYHNTASAGLIG